MKNKKKKQESIHDRIYNTKITWENILYYIDSEMERLENLADEIRNSVIDEAFKAVYLAQIDQRMVSLHMAANASYADKNKSKVEKQDDSAREL